jgi:outer membrane protein assembly factor BamB
MKCRLVLFGLLCGLGILPQLAAQDTQEKDKDKKGPEKADITAKVREVNSDKYAAPPTQFRPGKVDPKAFDAKAINKTDTGFVIQMPSGAPIPTPTVYKDKIYVSGGFSTREYFCFDAADGKFVWGMNLDDDGPTSAVCGDDIVVFNTESCTIFALDANTGKNIWSHYLGDPLTSTPTIANGKVFTSYPANAGGKGKKPGFLPKIKGKFKLPGKNALPDEFLPVIEPEPAQEPAKESGAKHRPHASHAFICLELKTGKILWQKWIDSDVMSAPVAVDDEVYATTFAGTVYQFKQKDGEIVSAHRSRATSAPVVVGKNIYWTQRADNGKNEKCAEEIAGLDRDKLTQNFSAARREAIYLDAKAQAKSALGKFALKLDAGNALAPMMGGIAGYANIGQGSVSTMQGFLGSRILHYKNANYNCMGDELVNTDPKDGKIRWRVKLKGDLAKMGGHLAAPPAAVGGQLFVSTVEGEVLQVDPDDGDVTRTHKVGHPIRSQPAIEGGRIYVGTQDGKVVCINTGVARFTGWPTWGANMAHTNLVEEAKK